MHNFCKIFALWLVLGSLLIISACAKVSAPVPYEGSSYPHSYPQN